MVTVRESLDALPVVELAEVREKLRLNAEEREALEATAKRLMEGWAALALPAPLPAPRPAPAPSVPAVSSAALPPRVLSMADRAVSTLNSNPEKNYSAMELAQLWNIRSGDVAGMRSALARLFSRGRIRKVAFGRYTSIHSGLPR